MPMTLDDFYYLMRHPVNSVVGTAREFASQLYDPRKKAQATQLASPPPQVVERPATAATPAPTMYSAVQQLAQGASPERKNKYRGLTPEEELKVTSKDGQLAILNQGYAPRY